MTANQVLVLSPSSVYSDFISTVLPDLGEREVRQELLNEFMIGELKRVVARRYNIEPRHEYYEYLLSDQRDEIRDIRKASIPVKASPEMLGWIESTINGLVTRELRFEDIPFPKGVVADDPGVGDGGGNARAPRQVLVTAEELRSHYGTCRQRSSISESAAQTADMAKERIDHYVRRTMRPLTEEDTEVLSGYTHRIRAAAEASRSLSAINVYAAVWKHAIRVHPGLLSGRVTLEDIANRTAEWIGRRQIMHEDVTPLLLIHGTMHGFPSVKDVLHTIIDEAQDYSPLDYEFVKNCVPPDCGFTIVGDINQWHQSL